MENDRARAGVEYGGITSMTLAMMSSLLEPVLEVSLLNEFNVMGLRDTWHCLSQRGDAGLSTINRALCCVELGGSGIGPSTLLVVI